MKILYDHQVFSLSKYGGASKYFCELMKHLPPDYSFELSLLFSNNQHLKDNWKFFKKINFPIPQKESRIKGRLKAKSYQLNNLYSKCIISSNNYNLFHPTYFNSYFLKYVKKPYIVTVHDLIAFRYKDLYKNENLRVQMTEIIVNARRIISVSENTKKDLVEILQIDPTKIDVIHHGFNRSNSSSILRSHDYGRYILYVAARWGYKNFKTLAVAFSNLIREDSELKLICVGPPFSQEETAELKKLKIWEKSIAIGVNEETLNHLYAHALAFVYPSLYEGFGMSILEAFANNCPVCLSNSSSLPEVAGDAGVYFDPKDPDSVLHSIKKVIYDPEFSRRIIEAGNKRLYNFSWQKCTDETLKSYKKAVL